MLLISILCIFVQLKNKKMEANSENDIKANFFILSMVADVGEVVFPKIQNI